MAGTLDLSALNKSSAKVATFLVKVAAGRVGSYTYSQEKDNRQVTQHKFEAYFIGKKAEPTVLASSKVQPMP